MQVATWPYRGQVCLSLTQYEIIERQDGELIPVVRMSPESALEVMAAIQQTMEHAINQSPDQK